ncbi:7-carboxy-7-deazaguanine synthase QueE [Pleionea sp. CnH1-48]|uniref:7-carboxy-7-deazaguanine synthase QueE n=1 Tax=Pleionea sp. CnH1-48 TaxID=2954494 RepID=UPI0020985AEB|nr:7-carboxy-7-deazaguanine synthase QueE [Pleionea sp. CnH1-48]
MTRLRLTEVFYSLQGETRTLGLPTVFVRLTGCPLRCVYCDTEYAFTGGEYHQLEDVVEQVSGYNPRYVTVTGGEPLAQKQPCEELLTALCDKGYEVSLETSGAMDIAGVDPRVVKVMDLKTPDSGELDKNRLENLEHIDSKDQLKFVLCSRKDYDWARMMLDQYQLAERCEILFSPSYGQLNATELADWIVEDNLPVRFQVQLHKLLWNDEPGH